MFIFRLFILLLLLRFRFIFLLLLLNFVCILALVDGAQVRVLLLALLAVELLDVLCLLLELPGGLCGGGDAVAVVPLLAVVAPAGGGVRAGTASVAITASVQVRAMDVATPCDQSSALVT